MSIWKQYAVQVKTTQIVNIWAASEDEAYVQAEAKVREAGGYKSLESTQEPEVEYMVLGVQQISPQVVEK